MSINSLTNAAVARRMDFAPVGRPPQGLKQIASAASFAQPLTAADVSLPPTPPTAGAAGAGAPPQTPPANGVNTALHVLFGYIPTEILTLYVAVLAALHKPGKVTDVDWKTFISFLIATPIVVWIVYAVKIKAAGKPVPWWPSQWPLWEIFAATIAYTAWAFALPDSPFTSYEWYSSALAALIVLIASTVLGLVAPLFQRPIKQA